MLISFGILLMLLLIGLNSLVVIAVILSLLHLFGIISSVVIVIIPWIQLFLEFEIAMKQAAGKLKLEVLCLLVKYNWRHVMFTFFGHVSIASEKY